MHQGRETQPSAHATADAQRPVAENRSEPGAGMGAEIGAPVRAPAIALPKGGGAIRGMGEKFAANPVTGTGSFTVPIATSPGRAGFGPQLALTYDSGAGNGPFGFGWTLALPAITRKTDKGLPRYEDATDSDTFLLSGAEDLVPEYSKDAAGAWRMAHGTHQFHEAPRTVNGVRYIVRRYRPRIEGLFARIERWTHATTGETHWRSISRENVTTLYGFDNNSRIYDPADPNPAHSSRIFSWLICATWDDKGNAVAYRYKAEDGDRIDLTQSHERNRGNAFDLRRSANRYIKRVLYGNTTSLLAGGAAVSPLGFDAAARSWHFEVVFDYGEHDETTPTSSEAHLWTPRADAFSAYRSGFEVRTCRLCQRVLMFHHFPAEADVGNELLVHSTDLTYHYERHPADVRNPVYSLLVEATQTGYRRAGATYTKKSLPPLEFTYSQPTIQQQVEVVDRASLANLPVGLDGTAYQWVDLHGEGIPGILSEQAGAWFYKRNLAPLAEVPPLPAGAPAGALTDPLPPFPPPQTRARFAPVEVVTHMPNAALAAGAQILDLASDGQPDLVTFGGAVQGFYEHDAYPGDPDGWLNFRPFVSPLGHDPADPNLRFVDLTGDGHADVLITEDRALHWHESLGEAGFGPGIRVALPLDEEKGPRCLFADAQNAIYLADLSGDGLTDLVRIRNGEVCYWPNLGYGRFGARVAMENAPRFDRPGCFDHRRLRLADIDGSGATDLIYLHGEGVRIWFNQSGNGWSAAIHLRTAPRIDNLAAVTVVDLLGNGTACLVWSSPLGRERPRQMRYIDLMGGQKPHLLVKMNNNLGAETRVAYVSSIKFYLADREAGRPWLTRLPFPVHVVECVETWDHISRSRFSTRYAYHHGYFDGEEREFRGFGMVERIDTEAYASYVAGVAQMAGDQETAPELYQPPVTTRTWYHSGAHLQGSRILHHHHTEYYGGSAYLPEARLPANLTLDEMREAMRALKGTPLREEVYSFDQSKQADRPYSVTETSVEVRSLQPLDRRCQGREQHGVFFVVGRETISLNFERNPADPRISHSFALDLDEYGNMRKSCTVIYGRAMVDPALPVEVTHDQQRRYITTSELEYTDDFAASASTEAYRLRVPFESRAYEITGIAPAGALFTFEEIAAKVASALPIDYETLADGLSVQKRLLALGRMIFRNNALAPLPLGQWDTLGLDYQSYRLVFTPGFIAAHYASAGGAVEVGNTDFAAAGYVHFAGDMNWWAPSGTAIYPANAAARFYLPIGARDPLGLETVATRDAYDLLTEQVEVVQVAWNRTTAVNNYRVLAPVEVMDANGNRSAVEHDEVGMVIKSAIMGKAGAGEGDTLDDPTVRIEYDLFNWKDRRKPNFAHSFAREQHGAANPRWQESYAYSNGSGSIAMVKTQTSTGKAYTVDAAGTRVEVDADPRWVGNGRTVVNNKGKPVKQYEPYFSATHEYEDEKALREIGVAAVLYYDPVGRAIRTEFPDGTLARVEFTPWLQRVYDANDTVLESQWYMDRGSPSPAQPEPLNDAERRSAWQAAQHANTPGVVHFDSLGRSVYAVSDYGGGVTAAARSESDLTGRHGALFDQLGRRAAGGIVGMLGQPIVGESAERGRRWTFQNILGALVKTWDEWGRRFRVEYDMLHRPIATYARETGKAEILYSTVVYGDRLGAANARARNLLGVEHLLYDQAGAVRIPALDFKGNPTAVERMLARGYKQVQDWSTLATQPTVAAIEAAAAGALEVGEVFTASSLYDALNRPTRVTLPDGTILLPTYNEANILATLKAQLRGQGAMIDFLKRQDCDAKGQRQYAHYGNDLVTRYLYDPATFRLTRLFTQKEGVSPQPLQDLRYLYDPVGNIAQILDNAQPTHFFNNAVVKAQSLFTYDAVYQLIRATGRELAGGVNSVRRSHSDIPAVQLPHPNNTAAVRTYTEEYSYDLLGNIKQARHHFAAQAGAANGWTLHYRYTYENTPGNRTNRLASTSLPGDADAGPWSGAYAYDAYGSMTQMPHLAALDWNVMDQLQRVDLGGGGEVFYVYDAGGQRIRKVIERPGNRKLEWIYLGPVMIFRRRRTSTSALRMERWTVHISDNTAPIAQADTKTLDLDNDDPANPINATLIRYQYGNHLGSATIETDANGFPISYEEYHPFGTTAYRSGKPGYDQSLKRFRFSGKERDDETGLYYFGARYYAPWLGRWISCDPAGFVSGMNLYRYCRNSPVILTDPTGMEEVHNPIYVKPKSEVSKLANPARKAEAKTFLEGAYTDKLARKGQQFKIDSMHFDAKRKMWLIDKWHFEAKGAEGSGESEGVAPADAASPTDGDLTDGSGSSPSDAHAPKSAGATNPPDTSSANPGSGGEGEGGGPGSSERSFFTSSFFRGLAIGLAITVLAIAVVATAGAAAPAIAAGLGASASTIATASTIASGVAVVGSAAGVAATGTSIYRSVRQEDFWGNPISEEEANFNLGIGFGSVAGGALAKPVAAAGTGLGQSIGRGLGSTSSGGGLALAGGGVYGGATTATVSGVTSTSAVGAAGTGMGTGVLMMSGNQSDDSDDGNWGRGRSKGTSFRGGSKKTRDNWYGYDRDKDFVKWWHRQGKAEFGGNDINNAEEAQEVFEYWVSIGKPVPK